MQFNCNVLYFRVHFNIVITNIYGILSAWQALCYEFYINYLSYISR